MTMDFNLCFVNALVPEEKRIEICKLSIGAVCDSSTLRELLHSLIYSKDR